MESQEQTMPRSFEEVVLPHLDAAFNYARWLTKNDADAEDARAAQMILSGSRSGPSCRGWRGHARGWRVCWPSAS
jgi:RNA polymerase sigma-70 factor (ECF subfamily)